MPLSELPSVFDWNIGSAAGSYSRIPVWLRFDQEWFRARYPASEEAIAAGKYSSALEYYLQAGQLLKQSPNKWFDETWYLATYSDVADAVASGQWKSGFQHYVQHGYRERSPHWLFSEEYYRSFNPELTSFVFSAEGCANGYDHYLSGGECGYRSGSVFFDPGVFSCFISRITHNAEPYGQTTDSKPDSDYSLFLTLSDSISDRCRTSWYFDPVWYLDRYPEVRELIRNGTYTSALHHYVTAGQYNQYSPQASFSEEFYREKYPDVAACISAGLFRSGYDHFLTAGASEGRLPAPDVSLTHYASLATVRADIESGLFRDPYAHWIAAHEKQDPRFCYDNLEEMDAKLAFCRLARGLTVQSGRSVLDFTCPDHPVLSVIMVLHNQFALTLMALASLRDNFDGNIELIIIDSCSHDETIHLERYVQGAKITHLRYNAGFLLSCNMALEQVTANAVLYLNNDVRLAPGAVRAALNRLHSSPHVGAVGGKIIRTNGLLQEAGSIIWRDGGTLGYLRDHDPNCPEANFVRDVDYCSGAFLLVPTALAKSLGGFDESYCPAYFEEADFCVRLIRKGYRVVYDPSVVIEHLEFGSSTSEASIALMQRNKRVFVQRQAEFLRDQLPAHLGNAVLGRSRRSAAPRVLFIEDRVPLRSLGSGYVRSNDIVRSLARQGCAVTVFPINTHYHSLSRIYSDFPDTVEVLFDRSAVDLDTFLEERAGSFDAVWIGRTHNLARILPVLHKNTRYMAAKGFILDTEAVVSPRLLMRERVLGLNGTHEDLDEKLRAEFECAYFCQQIVAVTGQEADFIRRAGHSNVSILGHALKTEPTRASFSARKGLLFVGAVIDAHSPNLDSLLWFMRDVMPLLREKLGEDIRLTAVGFRTRGVDLGGLREFDGIDVIEGADDLREYYEQHRVFVAPTRFAGGIPYKVHESAAHGVPVVASDVLIGQLGWTSGKDILSGGAPDAATFAEAVTTLYQNEELWEQVRQEALHRVETDCSPAKFDTSVMEILKEACR